MHASHACWGQWMLEDAKNKNGTFVNGAAVTRVELADGYVVRRATVHTRGAGSPQHR